MQDELIIYVRNKKLTPIGATYFSRTAFDVEGVPVVAMGWSKACKTDVFTKKTGRHIATKRATKASKWLDGVDDVYELKYVELDSHTYEDNTRTVPFAIKNNIKYYLETAKEALRLAAQKLPVKTKFIMSRDFQA